MLIDDGLELLDEGECRSLLAPGGIGRVGVTVGALPVIFPVNFAYVDGDVVFRTGEGTKLRQSREGTVIAFEVDAYDPAVRTGWSVLAIGRAREVTDAAERSALEIAAPAPWVAGDRSCYVRMCAEVLTGRRIVTA